MACYNTFALKFFDQGLDLSSAIMIHALAVNVHCPYHCSILGLSVLEPRAGKPKRKPSSRLASTPPLGLTGDICLGSAAACGCTCGQAARDDVIEFTNEVDTIMQQSQSLRWLPVMPGIRRRQVQSLPWSLCPQAKYACHLSPAPMTPNQTKGLPSSELACTKAGAKVLTPVEP